MRKKNAKKLATSIAAMSAVAASAFVVSHPAQAATMANAEKLVVKAEKLAGALKWQVSYDYRKKVYPKNVLDYPDMKLFNETKSALKAAREEVKKLKRKEKDILEARLTQNVQVYVDRATSYIDAVSAGKKIEAKANILKKLISNHIVNDSTEKAYHDLTKEIRTKSPAFYKVYGASTRTALVQTYLKPAQQVKDAALYPVSIKIETDRLNAALKENKIDQAIYHKNRIEKFVSEGLKIGVLKENSNLLKSVMAYVNPVKAELEKRFAIFNADSTAADKPTTFGGTAAAVKKYDQSVILIAGKNQYIKLANAEVNGNIIIKGNETGAGTVYLENVKVNKVNNQGGVIIVDDVADHSLYQKNVTAEELKINDANGANIVAEEGTKIKTLSLTETAGATGAVILESKEKGAYEVVSIGTKGSESSKGVELKGDFSNTKVEVTGEGSQIKVAKDAVVKEIEVKTEAKLEAEQGAKVQAVNLAAEKSGQKIELKGDLKEATVTVKNANAKIEVAKDSVIKEIKKDSSVTGSIQVTNSGTIQTSTGVTVNNKDGGQTGPQTGSTDGSTGSGSAGSVQTAPTLTADNTDAKVGNDIELTFAPNTDWQGKITAVEVDGVSVATEKYTVTNGKITLDKSLFTTAKNYSIVIKATGYTDAIVVQPVAASDQTAPTMEVHLYPGFALGSTSINYIPENSNQLVFKISDQPVSTIPNVGDTPPSDVKPYNIGDDITDISPNQYIQLYELDSDGKIVKFKEIQITERDINSSYYATRFTFESDKFYVEFNSPLKEETFANDDIDKVIKYFNITAENFSINKSNIKSIKWIAADEKGITKLEIQLDKEINLLRNYIISIGYVPEAVKWITPEGQDSNYLASSEISGDVSDSVVIEHIKALIANGDYNGCIYSLDHLLHYLSKTSKIQNYNERKFDLYQKYIVDNKDRLEDLNSLQNIVDEVNEIPTFDAVEASGNTIKLIFSENVWIDGVLDKNDIIVNVNGEKRSITNLQQTIDLSSATNSITFTIDGQSILPGQFVKIIISETGSAKIKDIDGNSILPINHSSQTVLTKEQTLQALETELANLPANKAEADAINDRGLLQQLLERVNTVIENAKSIGVTEEEIKQLPNYERIAVTEKRIADIDAAAKAQAVEAVKTELAKLPADKSQADAINDRELLQELLDGVNTAIENAKSAGATEEEIEQLPNYGRIAITKARIADIDAAAAKAQAIEALETELAKLPADKVEADMFNDKEALQELLEGVNTAIENAKSAGVTEEEIEQLPNYGRIAVTEARIADIEQEAAARARAVEAVNNATNAVDMKEALENLNLDFQGKMYYEGFNDYQKLAVAEQVMAIRDALKAYDEDHTRNEKAVAGKFYDESEIQIALDQAVYKVYISPTFSSITFNDNGNKAETIVIRLSEALGTLGTELNDGDDLKYAITITEGSNNITEFTAIYKRDIDGNLDNDNQPAILINTDSDGLITNAVTIKIDDSLTDLEGNKFLPNYAISLD
ncbi:hemoblobin-interacting domain-containing protein [Geobacillus sp. CAMR5420]|uniref:hemoblobin-interacting domain-containing protein n=1 Tax=Geobacillus sp. CAMR5420 TaxID=1482739 RepID=UPI0004A0F9F3|nr:hemoblobin-interacting domain-containing protein [Geobacillus sp. CAMR5420]KDE45830.1 hypothetical protein DI44_18620 [Geobacillus sp. CAMR5420]